MFKHLTRLSQLRTAAQSTVSNVILHKPSTLKTGLIRNATMAPQFNMFTPMAGFSTAAQASSKRKSAASLVPDYHIDEATNMDLKKVVLTPQEINNKHPTEYILEQYRSRMNYLNHVADNELLLFNLPDKITKEKIIELCSVKGVQIISASLTPSMNKGKRIAVAHVQVANPSQVKTLKERFNNVWIEDRKIKMKAREELQYENFDHRTVIIRGLPIHYQQNQLIEIFQPYGAVVGIELPMKNAAVEQELKNKVNEFEQRRELDREIEIKRAQKLVKDTIKENIDYYQSVFSKYLGAEEAQKMVLQLTTNEQTNTEKQANRLLDDKRHISIQHMITQLQAEGVQVTKAKSTLIKLKDYVSADEAIPGLEASTSSRDVTAQLTENKDLLKNTLNYLRQNREAIDETTLAQLNTQINTADVDPIQHLQTLSRSELAQAYDTLIECLNFREMLIEKRIKEQITHLGKEERVLFEHKDWDRETEDIKKFDDPFNNEFFKAEEILSVNEQINNIERMKNITPQERLYQMVTRQFNPFLPNNFNVNQLANAQGERINTLKFPKHAVDPNKSQSENRVNFKGFRFFENHLEDLQEQVAALQDQFDIPFDELYHKEKHLVDAVIQATKALETKEAALPDPMGAERVFALDELQGEYLQEEFQPEHPYIKAERKKNEKLLNEQIDSDGSSRFQFKLDETKSKIQALLEDGLITKKEYDMLVTMERQAHEVNMGYAFITYSHTDEAKMALIMAQSIFLDGMEADLMIKQKDVDHKDFDFRYQINKQRNEAAMVKELQTLRESRKELRDFEQNIDKDLPSLKKLKEFRELAREVIDNNDKPKFGTNLPKRNQVEEDALNEKIRKLQKENPDIDYTQLFDTERAEAARKAQHKKAFASYKAFQFLKNGVQTQSKRNAQSGPIDAESLIKKKTPAPYQSADPYDFPPLKESVSTMMRSSKDGLPRILDAGEPLASQPGRKFGYTEQDFLDAYFGKDNARAARVTLDDESSVFGFNDSFKRKYPIDKYLKFPEVQAQQRMLEEKAVFPMDMNQPGMDLKTQYFAEYMKSIDTERENMFKDVAHPTDKNRTFLKDIEQRMENYSQRKQKVMGVDYMNSREVGFIGSKLKDEYFPKPKKEVAAPVDAKEEDKFEPFYEGETAGSADSAASDPAPSTESAAPTSEPAKPKKEFKKRPDRHDRHEGGVSAHKQGPLNWQKTINYKGTAKEEIEITSDANEDVKDLNKDFAYEFNYRQDKLPADKKTLFDSQKLQRFKQFAEGNNMKPEELFDKIKDSANLTEENVAHGGFFQDKERFGLNKTEADIKGRERRQRSIEDFAGKSSTSVDEGDLSEREEEDIYNHYIEEMRKAKLEAAQEKPTDKDLNRDQRLMNDTLKEMEDGIFQDMPRFEGFFRSQAKGKHPFEEEEYQYKDKTTVESLREEEAYDEELLQRELEGRLMGETLTPRQFEQLYKFKKEAGGAIKYLRDHNRNAYLDARDIIRLLEEQREGIRRKNVLDGTWTEQESTQKIKEMLEEYARKSPTQYQEKRMRREFDNMLELLSKIQNPQKFFEKEYYFDEGLGQSLKDHVEDIKGNFPDLQVLVRRDRDGYAIIKTQYKPNYKYKLEDLENMDVDQNITMIKETLDDYLKTVIGQKGIQGLDREQLQSKLQMTTQNQAGEMRYDFDAKTKAAIGKLYEERTTGRFKNDREGFAKAFMELSETVTYDTSKPLGKLSPFSTNEVDTEKIYNELIEERELLTYELAEQLSLRVKEHLFLKERKTTDFVRPRRSEINIFDNQVQSHENRTRTLEDQAAQIEAAKLKDEGAFDKEAYQEIKAEIKKRREAKERLLKQGFPELKPYLSL